MDKTTKEQWFQDIEAKQHQLELDPINAPLLNQTDLHKLLLKSWIKTKSQQEVNYGFKA